MSNLANYQDNNSFNINNRNEINNNNSNILRPDIHAELARLLCDQDFSNNFNNNTFADIESVSISYMTEKERYEQLKMMLDEDYYRLKSSSAKYDPCLETEILLRRAQKGVDKKRLMHKYLRSKSVNLRSVGSQTHNDYDDDYFPYDKKLITSAKSMDRLDHSILELTSVINDSTVVSGRTIKSSPKEKFSVKINLPSGSSDNEEDSSVYSNSYNGPIQPAKLNKDYYYYPKLASAVITPNTSINLSQQLQTPRTRSISGASSNNNSPRDYSHDNKYQFNSSVTTIQTKPFVLECNEVEKFDTYETIKEGNTNSPVNPNKIVVNRIPSNTSNLPSASTNNNKYETIQHLVLPSSNLSNVNSTSKNNKLGPDFKKNLLKNKQDVIDIDFDRYERKSLSPQPRPPINNKPTNYNQFIGKPQQRQQQPPPIAPRPASRNTASPQTNNVFRYDDASIAEKENRTTTSKYTNLNSRLYFNPRNQSDKIDIDLSIYDEQTNTISKNNNNYSNSTSTSSLYNKKNNSTTEANKIEEELYSKPKTKQIIFHEFLKSTSETIKIVDSEPKIQVDDRKINQDEMVQQNQKETKIKVTGYSTPNLDDNKNNKNLSKNLQTFEIKKESKLNSNDLNASNIEVSGRDPSVSLNSNVKPIDLNSISSKENLANLDEAHNTSASSISESDSLYQLKILKIMKETSEREYQNLKHRIEKTRQRIPQIYQELETASGKKRFSLEKELDLLLKRLRMDKYKLKQYKILNEKKNEDTGSLNNKLIQADNLKNLSKSSMEKYEFASSSESLPAKNMTPLSNFKSNLKKSNQNLTNIPQQPPQNPNQVYQVFWCGMPEYNINKKHDDQHEKDYYVRPYGTRFNESNLNLLIDENRLNSNENLIHLPIDEIFGNIPFFTKSEPIKNKKSSIKKDLALILKQDLNKNQKCKDQEDAFYDDMGLIANLYQNILNSSYVNSKLSESFLHVPDVRLTPTLVSGCQNSTSRFIDEHNENDFFRFNNRYNYFGGSGGSVRQASGRMGSASSSSNQPPRMSTFGSNSLNNSNRSNPSTVSYNSRSNNNYLPNNNSNNLNPNQSNLSTRSNQSSLVSNEGNIRKKTLLEIDYIEEDDLNYINLSNFELIEDKDNNETLLVDLNNPNDRSVILEKGWIESEESPYIAEENVDLTNLEIFQDQQTKRRYVVDESTGKRYYIVSLEKMRIKRNNLLRLNKRVDSMEKIDDSEQVIHFKYNENESDDSEQFLGYVEEDDLIDFDMGDDAIIYEDPVSKEIYIAHKNLPNKRWIMLPQNWQIEETSPYLDEEDVEEAKFDIYVDSFTNRKFIIDEKTGQRYYLIPPVANNFKNDWLKILNNVNSRQQVPDETIRNNILTNPNASDRSRSASGTDARNVPNKQDEPFNIANKNSPNKILIKQPGRPGHLIKNDPNDANTNKVVPKPIIKPSSSDSYNRPNTSRSLSDDRNVKSNQLKDSTGSSRSPQRNNNKNNNLLNKPGPNYNNKSGPAKSKSPYKLNNSKIISKQQQQMAKMKQEQARRVFFAQRLPDMDRLWLHQLLIQQVNREKRIDARRPSRPIDNVVDESTGRNWRSLTDLNDPTLIDGQLDRDRLADIQINGYDKYDKKRQNRNYLDRDDGKSNGSYYNYKQQMRKYDKSDIGFGGDHPQFMRGVLTEQYQDYTEYVPMRISRNHRALVPVPRKYLRRQFLLTPKYLKDEWKDALDQNYKLKPTLILINDDEKIITANKNCNVYVQYVYDNDAVTGADRAYQLMLPDRGPTSPTRPLMIKQRRLNKLMKLNPLLKPEMALREAPVFVNHNDGTSYFENIAQYLAQNYAKLSPKTARTILQFTDSKEFEQYLASKITREQAKKIAEESGERLINLDAIKTHLLNIVNDRPEGDDEPLYYHKDCEYDPLRNLNDNQQSNQLKDNLNETKEYEIGGQKIKSTFVGFTPSGELERLSMEDLPQNILDALKKADQKIKNNKK